MKNLFGEPYEIYPLPKPINKKRRNWENRFQRWSDNEAQDGCTSNGKCGYSGICDYCKDNDYGRPCVRALNAYCKDKKKQIDYNDTDYRKFWDCDF